MSATWEQLESKLENYQAIETALILFEWDSATLAPEKADQKTARMVGALSEMALKACINDEVRQLKEELKKEGDGLTLKQRGILRQLDRRFDELESIPPEEYRAFSELKATATRIWSAAKEADDFDQFAPVLEKIVNYKKKFADYRRNGREGLSRYDILLRDFEPGFDTKALDQFFNEVKKLIPFIKETVQKAEKVDKSYNFRAFDREKQKKFCEYLAEYVGFERDKGVIAESAHPFTTNLHNEDVRITNHYYEDNLESAIFSIIHEAGHAVYEQQVAEDLTQTLVGCGATMAVHESQSRFYENIMGRSKAFWKPLYGKLKESFPEELSDVTLDQLIQGINRPQYGMIRTEADELTYPLHILIRYEVERQLMEDEIEVKDIPKLWGEKCREYLGREPGSDKEGALQDVHWAGGDFGYFPSYALGNAIGAQIYAGMKKELPFEACLEQGDIEAIKHYLGEHIHKFGAVKDTNELLKDVTGEEFNPKYYVEYLKEKYTRLYA